jgi:hypothetical protein
VTGGPTRYYHGWHRDPERISCSGRRTERAAVTTVATSVTGFGFPVDHLLPSHVIGIVSLVVLAVAILARYGLRLRGAWRPVYVLCAALALYLNVFVGVVQAFLKVAALHALAPHQTEPPFLVTQLVVLALFIALAVVAAKRFRHASSIHVAAFL